jgi:hypothetical protein
MTKTQINRAIRHLGVQIVSGTGYFYFVDLAEKIGQVGNSVMVCYLNQQSLQRWVSAAQYAINEYEAELQQTRLK